MLVEQFFDPGLGHASYLVADPEAGVAFLVDPERDPQRYLAAASRLGVLITHSLETHVHNDYVAGSRALALLRPITVVAGAEAQLDYPHRSLADGEALRVGALEIRCLATPGHTPEHVSYLVADLRRADDPQYLFSGGALLVGHIARVDLFGPALQERLARDAFATLREKLLALPDYVAVFPTHGGGSACSTGVESSRWTTLGFERKHNEVARAAQGDFDSFRAAVTHELPVAPAYYPHVRALNGAGPTLPARSPLPLLADDALRAQSGTALIDPRPPHVFGGGHRPGALNVVGNDSFATRVGSVVPFGTPIVLLTEDAEAAERLRAQLGLIAYDDVRGYASPIDGDLARIEQLDPVGARERAAKGDLLLDVREASEWESGHLPGAVHVPYGRLVERLGELPAGRPIVAYCASGARSSLATSLLAAAGREARNLRGGIAAWRGAGLPTTTD